MILVAFPCHAALPTSFDYIVVGAGTSGLVVANRLSEDPSVTVGIIEPGTDQRSNENVTDWTKFNLNFGTDLDWNYPTTTQFGLANRQLNLHQGKAWGGTSAINGEWLDIVAILPSLMPLLT
jgi:choline dehydrogenase